MADNPFDGELFSGGTAPSASDLAARINENLSSWLRYVSEEPSLYELNLKAEEIMVDLGYATAIPATINKALELVTAVDTQFERLGLWRQWYPRLMGLYSPVMDRLPANWKAELFRTFVNHYLYRGDLLRANAAINAILDLAADKWNEALQDAMVGVAYVATGLETDDRAAKLAQMLISLAYVTHNDLLLGRSYSVLSQYYADRFDNVKAFIYGQMVYCIGIKSQHDPFILNGLHFMALAFQVGQDYPRAITYLEYALEYACLTGDKFRIEYMLLTWGMCSYATGDYIKAEGQLRDSIAVFKDAGHYYASALYAHGLCLMSLNRYEEAEQDFKTALAERIKQKRVFDAIYVKHGLAELYSVTRRHAEAILLSLEALSEAESMAERAGEYYLKVLRADVVEYQRRRDVDASKRW